jgi:3-deoxy-D-arabino-heptulosonate 7-phosphate (DAHP) synthase class II
MQIMKTHAQNGIAVRYLYHKWATGFVAQHICGERVRKLSTPSGNKIIPSL